MYVCMYVGQEKLGYSLCSFAFLPLGFFVVFRLHVDHHHHYHSSLTCAIYLDRRLHRRRLRLRKSPLADKCPRKTDRRGWTFCPCYGKSDRPTYLPTYIIPSLSAIHTYIHTFILGLTNPLFLSHSIPIIVEWIRWHPFGR